MTEGSWTQVQQAPATADGTRTSYFPVTASIEKMFWRVKIEDVDSDGSTIVLEAYLNLDPNTPHTPPTGPIGQQCIVNGDFSSPPIGTGLRNNPNATDWDYWGAGIMTGEKVNAEVKCKVSFTDSSGSDPLTKYAAPGAWTTVVMPFTANNPTTWIHLVPVNSLDDTTGCLVDNVKLMPVDITVVFGVGPGGRDQNGNLSTTASRDRIKAYLDRIKILRFEDYWIVPGKDPQGQNIQHGVAIRTNEPGLVNALNSGGETVIFDGHANFGLGPNFSRATHKTIPDFTNVGVKHTDIPKEFRGSGTEDDILPADPGVGAVVTLDGRTGESGWFLTPVTIHRWQILVQH